MGKGVVVITGTSSGFGNGSARDLTGRGYEVFATMRKSTGRNKEAAESLRRFTEENGAKLTVLDMDVTSENSVSKAIKTVLDQAGQIDVLINNAGIMPLGVNEAFTTDQLLGCLQVNVVGLFRVAKAVLPSMRERQAGLVINIGSVVGRVAMPYEGVYHASKYAVEGLSESMRYELAPFGIDVVIIEPGPFATKLVENSPGPADESIVRAYGEEAKRNFQAMYDSLVGLFSDPNMPTDPQIVVDMIREIIETPAGDRPLRLTAGVDLFASGVNEASAPYQAELLKMIKLEHLASSKTARARAAAAG